MDSAIQLSNSTIDPANVEQLNTRLFRAAEQGKTKVVKNLKTSNKESENEEIIFTQSTKNKLTAEKEKPKKEITEKSKLSNLNDPKITKNTKNHNFSINIVTT